MLLLRTNTNLICGNQETKRPEGKTKVPHKKIHSVSWKMPAILAVVVTLMIVSALLIIPLLSVHRVYVTLGQDQIIDVSAQTTNVPIITRFFPAQSYPTGVYTILIHIQNITLSENNVPIGSYTFDLHNVETGVQLLLTVQLIRGGSNVDTFSIYVTF
jgi:hypothetical protein